MATRREIAAWTAQAQRPTLEYVPPYVESAGSDALALGARCGITDPLGYQEYVCDGSMGLDADGAWTAQEVYVILSRQNGKGVYGELRVFAGLGIFDEKLIFWTAHLVPTALEAQQRILRGITNCDELRSRVKSIVRKNGQEAIELYGLDKRTRITEPARVRFAARTRDSARGFTKADVIVYDESYRLTAEQSAAITPTMATSEHGQVIHLTSPPLDPSAAGPRLSADQIPGYHLHVARERVMAGAAGVAAYYEWGPENFQLNLDDVEKIDPDTGDPAVDLDDMRAMVLANPAYGRVLKPKSVTRERSGMSARGFARERLGYFPVKPVDPKSPESRLFDTKRWLAGRGRLVPADTIVIGVDSSPTRSGTSIVAYWVGPDESGRVCEFAELVKYEPGVGWVPDQLRRFSDSHDPLAIAYDGAGQIGAIRSSLLAEGFMSPSGTDVVPMWGELYEADTKAVAASTSAALESIKADPCFVVHGGQTEFTVALSSAKLRDVGEGLQVFSRRHSDADISPLVAWSIAKQCWKERYGVVGKFDPAGAIW